MLSQEASRQNGSDTEKKGHSECRKKPGGSDAGSDTGSQTVNRQGGTERQGLQWGQPVVPVFVGGLDAAFGGGIKKLENTKQKQNEKAEGGGRLFGEKAVEKPSRKQGYRQGKNGLTGQDQYGGKGEPGPV